jgi:hypothetical protein
MEGRHEHCFICRKLQPHKFVYYKDYAELEGMLLLVTRGVLLLGMLLSSQAFYNCMKWWTSQYAHLPNMQCYPSGMWLCWVPQQSALESFTAADVQLWLPGTCGVLYAAEHFQSQHHPCPHPACLERKFVVFPEEAELKRHFAAEHGADMNMSRAQRRQVRPAARRLLIGCDPVLGSVGLAAEP